MQGKYRNIMEMISKAACRRNLEMSQSGRLAVPMACLPAGRGDALMKVVAITMASFHDMVRCAVSSVMN